MASRARYFMERRKETDLLFRRRCVPYSSLFVYSINAFVLNYVHRIFLYTAGVRLYALDEFATWTALVECTEFVALSCVNVNNCVNLWWKMLHYTEL